MLHAVLPFGVTVVNGFLIVHIVRKTRPDQPGRHFIWPLCAATLWAVVVACVALLPHTPAVVLLGNRCILASQVCVGISLAWFCGQFPISTRWSSLLARLLAVLWLPWFWLAWQPAMLALALPGYRSTLMITGVCMPAYHDWFFAFGVALIVLLLFKARHVFGFNRLQLTYITLTFVLILFGAAIDLILPDSFFSAPFSRCLLVTILLGNVLTTYALTGNPRKPLTIFLTRGLVFSVTVVLLAVLFPLVVPSLEIALWRGFNIPFDVSNYLTVLLIALCYYPLYSALQRLQQLFKGKYDYRGALQEISDQYAGCRNIPAVLDKLTSIILRTVHPQQMAVYRPVSHAGGWNCVLLTQPWKGLPEQLAMGEPVLTFLNDQYDLVVVSELAYQQGPDEANGQTMQNWGFEVVLPLIVKDTVIGIVALGLKISGNAYYEDDLHFLRILVRQTALALENTAHYEELLEINASLEQRIHERTADLNRSITELHKAERAKDELLAVVSHELLTPVTSIMGWAEMAVGNEDADMTARALQVIKRNAQRQQYLVDDLLAMSRLKYGKMEMQKKPEDLWQVTELCLEGIELTAKERRITLVTQPPACALPIMADSIRIQQAISNLLVNACKYTPADGSVDLICDEVDGYAVLSITDTGEGIAPVDLDSVFGLFRQAAYHNGVDGLGLGLAIVKGIIELHGGTVQVSSEGLGHGSTFTVKIPLVESVTPAAYAKQLASETLLQHEVTV